MKMHFSREDSALKAYRQYLEQGLRVKLPYKDENLWVLEYNIWGEALTLKTRLDRSRRWHKKICEK